MDVDCETADGDDVDSKMELVTCCVGVGGGINQERGGNVFLRDISRQMTSVTR